jgi:RsiW-degrading membrane proteinase PrsW (M82 family)
MAPVLHSGDPRDLAGSDVLDAPLPDVDHTIWDEPGRSPGLSGNVPEDALTWFTEFRHQQLSTSALKLWLLTIAVALLSGPVAVVGTLLQGMTASGILMVVVIGPTTEEIMKIAIPVWIVEKRPWLFRSSVQILLCCFASGLVFAAVENLFYLQMPFAQASPGLARWRWSVCVLLHSSCSLLSGIGVVRMWRRFQEKQCRPDVADAAAPVTAAIVIHGIYNATVTAMQAVGWQF